MSKLLEADEIAALVDAAKAGRVPESTPEPARRVRRMQKVDFTRPTKFTVEHQRRIRRTMEAFAQACALRLSSELRCQVELELLNTVQLSWAAAQSQTPPQSLSTELRIDPLNTAMVLNAETSFVSAALNRLLGGGPDFVVSDRRFTDIEWSLAQGFLASIVSQLSDAWQEAYGLSLAVHDGGGEAEQVASPSDPSLLVQLEARLADRSFTAAVMIPWNSVAATLTAMAHQGSADTSAQTTAANAIAPVTVHVRAKVPSKQMTARQLLSLAPGDIIEFEALSGDGLVLCAENIALGRVSPGARGAQRAVQLTDLLDQIA